MSAVGYTREAEAREWLRARGRPPATMEAAAGDAGQRRYFRVTLATGSAILMDAPPGHEDTAAFLAVGERLRGARLPVPKVLAADAARGFVLLEDLGAETALQAMASGALAETDYLARALELLVAMQARARHGRLPAYDAALLGRELDLFVDWYLGRERGMVLDGEARRVWQAGRERLISAALTQPRVFVHRDFMARNLMPRGRRLAVIDFQDAVAGPLTYDPVCLLRDAFVDWPAATESAWLARYHHAGCAAGLPLPQSFERLRDDIDLMGAQRHLKVIGIFARLAHRDGKGDYRNDIPRFFDYLRRELAGRPAYAELAAWLAELEPA